MNASWTDKIKIIMLKSGELRAAKLRFCIFWCSLNECRSGLIMMDELRDAISKELDNLDTQLSQRMKLVISVSPDNLSTAVDLSCLAVVQQVQLLL